MSTNSNTIVLINNLVDTIVKTLNIEYPLTLEKMNNIMVSFNGRIEYINDVSFLDKHSTIIDKENNSFIILIADKLTEEKKLYYIAYELGDLILNKNWLGK